jgi:ABC-type lipoprotein release transport system permease subunit
MLLKLAWRNLWRNKRRTLITAASVFFAVLLANFMVAMQDGMYDLMIDNVVGLQMGYAQVHQKGYQDEQIIDNTLETTPELEKKLLSDPEVKGYIPRLETFALAASGDLSQGCAVIGIDPDAENAMNHLAEKISEGSYFASGPVKGALVAAGLAQKLKLKVGDTLIMIGQGYHAASAAGKFPITGLLRFGNPEMNKGMVYLTLPDAQHMYAAEGRVSSLVLDLKSPKEAKEVVGGISERLGPEYEALDWETMSPELMQLMEGDKGSNYLVVAILYLVVGFGIFGTVLMMTAERRHEFGVTVAIGMKRSKLALVVFMETLFVSMLGVVAGSLGAFPIVWYMNRYPVRLESLAEAYEQFGLEPLLATAVDPNIFIQQAIVVMVIAAFISIYPLQRILRINAVKSMRT